MMDNVLVEWNMIGRRVMLNEHYLLLRFLMKESRNIVQINVIFRKKKIYTIKFGTHFEAVVSTFAID
jgi:hypothetical protein